MNWFPGLVVGLMVLAAVLAVAEASISRITVARAKTIRFDGHRNAALLEEIAADPARYLNAIYLTVMLAQNGSATLVALSIEPYVDGIGFTLLSVAFTLTYFVIVEAMAKTFGVLHSDAAALAVAPMVWLLGRLLAIPARLLIGLANLLLPGKGLAQGPFVSAREIRSMADVSHEEGGIDREEKDLIHSVFQLGNAYLRHVMLPRTDVVAVPASASLHSRDCVEGPRRTCRASLQTAIFAGHHRADAGDSQSHHQTVSGLAVDPGAVAALRVPPGVGGAAQLHSASGLLPR